MKQRDNLAPFSLPADSPLLSDEVITLHSGHNGHKKEAYLECVQAAIDELRVIERVKKIAELEELSLSPGMIKEIVKEVVLGVLPTIWLRSPLFQDYDPKTLNKLINTKGTKLSIAKREVTQGVLAAINSEVKKYNESKAEKPLTVRIREGLKLAASFGLEFNKTWEEVFSSEDF